MIGYTTVGTNDMPRALAFYDALMEAAGAGRLFPLPRGMVYGTGKGPSFGVVTPFDGQPATAGNGTMIALMVKTPEEVDRLHALALTLGSADEGTPGPRGTNGFYGGYFRDLDGNKLAFFCRT